MSLRPNQLNAVKISSENNFKSGVHFHATGTGKSWISLEIILNLLPFKSKPEYFTL